MIDLQHNTSIIRLNISGPYMPIGRVLKNMTHVSCLQETRFKYNNIGRLKVKAYKRIYHADINQKKTGLAVLISDKTDCTTKEISRYREFHYVKRKESVHQENLNLQAPNSRATKHMK
jgi:hypothetical protein